MIAIGTSSVDRLARSKRPIVERTEIHIPPAPQLSPEAITGPTPNRLAAVSRFNADLQKWRNDAWAVEMPGQPDFALQTDVATLRDDTKEMIANIQANTLAITNIEADITTINNEITTIINNITTIEDNTATGTGIVQAKTGDPQDTVLGTDGHVPYWRGTKPYLSQTSPIYADSNNVGIGTDLPAVLLDIGLAGVTGAVVRLAGASGGNVTITTALVAGTWTWTLPVDDGAANQFLKTDGAGVTSWSSVVLTTDVTGILPVANGGTNASSWTAGSVIFAGAGGTALAEDNANIFWDNAQNWLGIGTAAAPLGKLHIGTLAGGEPTFNGDLIIQRSQASSGALGGIVFKSSPTGAGYGWKLSALNDANLGFAFASRTGSATWVDRFYVSSPSGNVGIGTATFGTSAARVLALFNGTTPSTSPADAVQLWALDVGAVAGNSGLHIRTESGGLHAFGPGLSVGSLDNTASGVINALTGYRVASAAATVGTFLGGNGTNFVPTALTAASFTHVMLNSLVHTDTLTGTVVRGDIIYGNSTPAWARLAKGATNTVLRANATDVLWGQVVLTTDVTGILPIANGGTNASSFQAEGIVYCQDTGTTLISSADFGYDDTIDTLFNRSSIISWRTAEFYNDSQDASATVNIGTWLIGTDAVNTRSQIIFGKEQNWTSTASTRDSYVSLETVLNNTTGQALGLRSSGSIVCGKDSTGTTRTDDFLYICSSAGSPTGVLTEFGSRAAVTYDSTNKVLRVYDPTDNTWRGVVLL